SCNEAAVDRSANIDELDRRLAFNEPNNVLNGS
uniref:Uncharacterized protein n=1 Tax=Romanomermis culicivorax TaxID=13658 RepID=A0A915L544_ROMCU